MVLVHSKLTCEFKILGMFNTIIIKTILAIEINDLTFLLVRRVIKNHEINCKYFIMLTALVFGVGNTNLKPYLNKQTQNIFSLLEHFFVMSGERKITAN